MPLGPKLDGENTKRKIKNGKNLSKEYLTMKQANYMYRKIDLGNLINKHNEAENRSRYRIRQNGWN